VFGVCRLRRPFVITVCIPVSPIPSMPETHILEETVTSIRHHLEDAEIFLMFDGVRPEQEHRREAYEEAIRRTLWLADKSWGATVPFIFDDHLHQVGMMRRVIDTIDTPLMLFCEQDTPLYTTETIDWTACTNFILEGRGNSIRYAHESSIPKEHSHLMHGLDGMFMRTSQYSARPHLASVDYYKRLLRDHFSPEANCFLEDPLHSVCSEAQKLRGEEGLKEHGLFIYHPEGSILRSYHLDARAGAPKWDDSQVF
jgi:hypothetical protein